MENCCLTVPLNSVDIRHTTFCTEATLSSGIGLEQLGEERPETKSQTIRINEAKA